MTPSLSPRRFRHASDATSGILIRFANPDQHKLGRTNGQRKTPKGQGGRPKGAGGGKSEPRGRGSAWFERQTASAFLIVTRRYEFPVTARVFLAAKQSTEQAQYPLFTKAMVTKWALRDLASP